MLDKDIRSFSLEELKQLIIDQAEKPFRAKQVYEWLWQKQVSTYDEMLNIPLKLRNHLKSNYSFNKVTVADEQKSTDGTIKSAFKTYDGKVVEGVLIPTDKRITACISSQVGCSLTCSFCGTGKLKRLRNLEASEIFDQVVAITKQADKQFKRSLTNIVYMGMGEPLLNYKEMMRSTDLISSKQGLNMSPKRITVSTAGIAKMIEKLGDDNAKFNLAISLHAANDEKRSEIMPINNTNTLAVLLDSLNYYYERTGLTITFEYIIFKDFNDSIEDAKELVAYCRKVPSKVNIIEYNAIDDGRFQKATADKVDAFCSYLLSHGVVAKIRRSRGKDIDAACGQLANKNSAFK